MDAVGQGDVQGVRQLVERNADVNICDPELGTPLIYAITFNLKETVELLLESKADPNKEDDDNRTPLMYACKLNLPAIAIMLLEHGANPNWSPNPEVQATPLMLSIYKGFPRLVEILLACGADPRLRFDGRTAEEYAEKQGHSDIVSMLRDAKVSGKSR